MRFRPPMALVATLVLWTSFTLATTPASATNYAVGSVNLGYGSTMMSYGSFTIYNSSGQPTNTWISYVHLIKPVVGAPVGFRSQTTTGSGYSGWLLATVPENSGCYLAVLDVSFDPGPGPDIHYSQWFSSQVCTQIEGCHPQDLFCDCTWDPCENTPLVLDIRRNGFAFSGLEAGVLFDMNGDGELDNTGWTDPGSDDEFLALDLNGDGRINDGTELFGDATTLASGSTAAHGFEALAQYDSNGDSRISADDEVFSLLLLWRDRNANGLTDPGELRRLASSGISEISLKYWERRLTDDHGNALKLFSWARSARGRVPVTDVFFVLDR